MKIFYKYSFIVFFIVFFDQLTKLLVHYNMELGALGQIKLIGNWLKIYYILNPGMAFGIQFGFKFGKLFLTLGRIIACFFIGRFIYKRTLSENKFNIETLGWVFVLAGAIGNVIDSTFYGILLNNSCEGSLFEIFHGQVIDMIYFDLFVYKFPKWIPFIGSNIFSCFPIFNIADTFVSIGIGLFLLKKFLERNNKQNLY
jgi:signal peptidase II